MSKVDLRDIVKGTPEAEAAMHRAMEQAQADMEAVRLAAEKHNGKQSTSSLAIDGKDVKPPTGLGEYTTEELEAEIKYRREHEHTAD